MKKILTLLLLTLSVITVSSQKRIAYVYDPTTQNDTTLRTDLETTYDLVLINGTTAGTKAQCEAADIAMVLISETLGSTAAGMAELEGVNKPCLMMKVFALKNTAWNWSAIQVWNSEASALSIDIASGQSGHAIFSGLTSPIDVITAVSGGKGIDYANIGGIAITSGTLTALSTTTGTPANTNIWEIAAGTVLGAPANVTIPEKMIIFGVNSLSQPNLSVNGLKLIKNICDYLSAGYSGVNEASVDFSAIGVKGALHIKLSEAGQVEVVDLLGNTIANLQTEGLVSIPASQGVYVVRVTVGNKTTARKILVQ